MQREKQHLPFVYEKALSLLILNARKTPQVQLLTYPPSITEISKAEVPQRKSARQEPPSAALVQLTRLAFSRLNQQ